MVSERCRRCQVGLLRRFRTGFGLAPMFISIVEDVVSWLLYCVSYEVIELTSLCWRFGGGPEVLSSVSESMYVLECVMDLCWRLSEGIVALRVLT